MVKGLLRFALVTVLTMLLTPRLSQLMNRLAERAPNNSFLEEMLRELSDQYASNLVRSFGQTVGELVLGSKE